MQLWYVNTNMSILYHVLYYTLIQEVYTYLQVMQFLYFHWFITSPKESRHLFDILLVSTPLKKVLNDFNERKRKMLIMGLEICDKIMVIVWLPGGLWLLNFQRYVR